MAANRELEIACKLGSKKTFLSAIEEGADVNCDGGSPLFLAIMNHQHEMVEMLVKHGADVSMFLPKAKLKKLKTDEAKIEALMAGAPPPVEPDEKEAEKEKAPKPEEDEAPTSAELEDADSDEEEALSVAED